MHILLAFQLAIWSPVMCCCAVKGAIGTVTGIHHEACRGQMCWAQQIQVDEVEPSCCGGESAEPDPDEHSPATSDGDCRCHERVIDKVQLDTGGRIHVPPMQGIAFASESPCEVGPMAAMPGAAPDRHLRSHPPPRTLLSQFCLLLI